MATRHLSLYPNQATTASFATPFTTVRIYSYDGDGTTYVSVNGEMAEIDGDDTYVVKPGEKREIPAPTQHQQVGLIATTLTYVEVEVS